MPSIIGHTLAALPINTTIMDKDNSLKIIIFSIICSFLPDIDTIGLYWGVEYSSFLGHRGFTHSILFVALAAFFIAVIFLSPGG